MPWLHWQLGDVDKKGWVSLGKSQGKGNKTDIMLEVCYRPLTQGEKADEIFYKQQEVSWSPALVLLVDSNFLDVC